MPSWDAIPRPGVAPSTVTESGSVSVTATVAGITAVTDPATEPVTATDPAADDGHGHRHGNAPIG